MPQKLTDHENLTFDILYFHVFTCNGLFMHSLVKKTQTHIYKFLFFNLIFDNPDGQRDIFTAAMFNI